MRIWTKLYGMLVMPNWILWLYQVWYDDLKVMNMNMAISHDQYIQLHIWLTLTLSLTYSMNPCVEVNGLVTRRKRDQTQYRHVDITILERSARLLAKTRLRTAVERIGEGRNVKGHLADLKTALYGGLVVVDWGLAIAGDLVNDVKGHGAIGHLKGPKGTATAVGEEVFNQKNNLTTISTTRFHAHKWICQLSQFRGMNKINLCISIPMQ